MGTRLKFALPGWVGPSSNLNKPNVTYPSVSLLHGSILILDSQARGPACAFGWDCALLAALQVAAAGVIPAHRPVTSKAPAAIAFGACSQRHGWNLEEESADASKADCKRGHAGKWHSSLISLPQRVAEMSVRKRHGLIEAKGTKMN